MTQRYDSIVVGAGQARPALAVRLAQAGRRTAIVERKRFAGTCVNTGCIPTKTLIASARVAYLARRRNEMVGQSPLRRAEYGWGERSGVGRSTRR